MADSFQNGIDSPIQAVRPRSKNLWVLLAPCLSLGFVIGCEKDEIRHYQAPRLEALPDAVPDAIPVATRMLAAIFPQPQQDRTWFFKLTGPSREVEKYKEEFLTFLRSVRFTKKGNPPVTYTVPEGWQRGSGDALRFATFRFGSKEKTLELSITPLGKEAGSDLANVNRWRNQLGLKEVDEAEMRKETQEMDVDGVKVTLVDLIGVMAGKSKMRPPFANPHPPVQESANNEASAQLPLTFQLPPGWKERPAPNAMILASFKITDEDPKAAVTISAAGGSLSANVNRWRNQIGLQTVSEEQIHKDSRPIAVGGTPGHYVDLSGPESAGGIRILAVMVPREEKTWFFKLIGPTNLVDRQKSAFESFVGSVRFKGSEGPKP